MNLDLNQSNVTLADEKFTPMLKNLQANILKGHGRDFAHHLFFQFNDYGITEAKQWIKDFADTTITSSYKQLKDTEAYKREKINGGIIYTLSLTSKGCDKLDLQKPDNPSFKSGMEASAELLGDKKEFYQAEFKNDLHMMILVAGDNKSDIDLEATSIINETSDFITLIYDQTGNVLKKSNGLGIEHFGYADGISQPLYLKNDINQQAAKIGQTFLNEWDDKTNLDALLIADQATNVPDSFGSYLVFRKLEQNVQQFKDDEGDNDKEGEESKAKIAGVTDGSGTSSLSLAGAMLVGRFEEGDPTVKTSQQLTPPPIAIEFNDFDYRTDLAATKCPFHGHIRMMNPRNGDPIADDVRAQRITRRGMPYDEAYRIPHDKITKITDEMLDNDGRQPTKGVGLLFMCYQSNISTQFEILQGFWANQGIIKDHHVNMQDSIISQGSNPNKSLPVTYGQSPQGKPFSFSGFVTMKGGDYFFTPSIPTLKSINSLMANQSMESASEAN